MKKDRRSKAFHSFAIVSGVAFLGLSLFASVLCFQTPPDEIRKNGVLLEGKVLKKIRSATPDPDHGVRVLCYLYLEILEDAAEKNQIRDFVSEDQYNKFKVGEIVPVWRYKGTYRVDKYGTLEIVSPWPFFTAAGVALLICKVSTRKYRETKKLRTSIRQEFKKNQGDR